MKLSKVSIWVIFLIPFFIYGLFIFRYAVNIPYQDDYDTVLDFTNTFIQIQSFWSKIAYLFSQHNEHRIVFDRIIFLGYYYIFHEVNFKIFILLGNFGWMLTIAMLVVYLQKNLKFPLINLLPIPYLLLLFSHWENIFHAMAAIQNYWFIFFVMAFLIFLSKGKLLLFLILFPIALFASGGGVILYPLGNFYLLLQKKWKPFLIFFMISTAFMALYFYNYNRPYYHPSILESLLNPTKTIAYFFTFLGNVFPLPIPLNKISFPIGIIIFLLSVYLLIKKNGDCFWQLVLSFIMLIAFTTALTRSGFGIWQAGASRYSLFPLLALICLYVLILTSISSTTVKRKVISVSIAITISFWAISTLIIENSHYFQKIKDQRIASIVAFSNGNKQILLYPDRDRAAQILLDSKKQHIYNYEEIVGSYQKTGQ